MEETYYKTYWELNEKQREEYLKSLNNEELETLKSEMNMHGKQLPIKKKRLIRWKNS